MKNSFQTQTFLTFYKFAFCIKKIQLMNFIYMSCTDMIFQNGKSYKVVHGKVTLANDGLTPILNIRSVGSALAM